MVGASTKEPRVPPWPPCAATAIACADSGDHSKAFVRSDLPRVASCGRCSVTIQTALMQRLGLAHPIVQAPLAGGGDTPTLVSAVCEAGGLGFIGGAYLTPAQIRDAARTVRERTSRPFGINLF